MKKFIYAVLMFFTLLVGSHLFILWACGTMHINAHPFVLVWEFFVAIIGSALFYLDLTLPDHE